VITLRRSYYGWKAWRRRRAAVVCAVIAAGPLAAPASADEQIRKDLDSAASLVASISASFGPRAQFGAGLIVAADQDGLLIATADHLVRQGNAAATSITVKFKSASERSLSGVVLKPHDRNSDIAVLRVAADNLGNFDICSLPIAHINLSMPLRQGQGVYPIGNPNGVAWQIPISPDRIAELKEKEIVFQSALLDRGYSGGGVFDTFGDLVGMIKADQAPYGIAAPVNVLAGQFRDWSLPFGTLGRKCGPSVLPPTFPKEAPVTLAMVAAREEVRRRVKATEGGGDDRALIDAIIGGDLKAVERLFKPTAAAKGSLTHLHLAVLFEQPQVYPDSARTRTNRLPKREIGILLTV
jgi:hypothetical protein